MKWRRVEAGLYERSDGLHRVAWTSAEGVGPRGGTVVRWEHFQPHGGDWAILGSSVLAERTLYLAQRAVDREFPPAERETNTR